MSVRERRAPGVPAEAPGQLELVQPDQVVSQQVAAQRYSLLLLVVVDGAEDDDDELPSVLGELDGVVVVGLDSDGGFESVLGLAGVLADVVDERESLMYQPLPLNTMPTG